MGTGRVYDVVVSSSICRTEEFRCWRNEMEQWEHERIWLFVDVRTMRVICSVKVKRKRKMREWRGWLFFQVWLPGLSGNGPWEWPKTWRLSWSSPFPDLPIYCNFATVFRDPRSSNRWFSILGAGHPRPWASDRTESKRLAEGSKEGSSWQRLRTLCDTPIVVIRCLISASGWRVRHGPLRTSGSAGSGEGI